MNNYAILIECDPGNTLGGSCTRDIENMASYLINKYNFYAKNIYLLTTTNHKSKIPDVMNYNSKEIFQVFDRINLCDPNLIIILLSGHGFSIPDKDGDECDGMDESINVGFQITDDEIYNKIVKKIKCNAILLADTCHSGTMFDLPFCYDGNINKFIKSSNRNDIFAKEIISLSACSDRQLSMCDVGDDTGFGGSLTTALLNIDDAMDNLLFMINFDKLYFSIKNRLNMLSQTLILSSSKQQFTF
jgi:hypothetical protein